MPEPVLELEGLEVRYGTVAAVRDVSLRVEKGEIVGLIGPNGAGKSTFFNCLTGDLPVTSGSVTFAGTGNQISVTFGSGGMSSSFVRGRIRMFR